LQAGALRVSEAGNAFERPIRLAYRPSVCVMTLLIVMHLGALVAVALSGIADPAKFAAGVLVAVALVAQLRRMLRGLRDPEPPVLQLDGRDEWRLLRAGDSDRATTGPDSLALPWLVVLHLRDAAQANRFFILTPDNAPRDVLRRLCVRLRFTLARGGIGRSGPGATPVNAPGDPQLAQRRQRDP
jgi:hypothetical protein